nr:tRNA-dihydrouridine(16/17) synthase [NAD(P)(+)]-like [Tanacetum cinerariifolium]
MAATKSFEDGLMEVKEKLEEIFTQFHKCCTQVRQEFSLQSDKVFKSVKAAEKEKKSKLIQAAVKEKKNRERQAHSYGLQQNRCYKRRMDAKLFWKKFVVASQPTKKLWISLGKSPMTSTTICLSTFLIQNNNTPTPNVYLRRHHKNKSTIFEEKHVELSENRAWAHWRKLKQPQLIVAPMYDGSELPFRMLCRKYGAQAAYTPMLHSRTFAESNKFRKREFSTCEEDRPLFVQFCGNDPDILLEAAYHVESYCDYVDINLGCPQRIARTGNYGAFLMDDLPLVKSLVEKLATNLTVPVSCKIRTFPQLKDTLNYVKLLEDAGCSLIAVHGRTRDERTRERANWGAIKSVKDAVNIPVLANGNIRHMDDVESCLITTGVEGVMSAVSLLDNPALFAGFRGGEWVLDGDDGFEDGNLDRASLVVEYLKLCEKYPVRWKIIVSHVYGMLEKWFEAHPDIRDDFNIKRDLTFEYLYDLVDRLRDRGVQFPLYVKKTRPET